MIVLLSDPNNEHALLLDDLDAKNFTIEIDHDVMADVELKKVRNHGDGAPSIPSLLAHNGSCKLEVSTKGANLATFSSINNENGTTQCEKSGNSMSSSPNSNRFATPQSTKDSSAEDLAEEGVTTETVESSLRTSHSRTDPDNEIPLSASSPDPQPSESHIINNRTSKLASPQITEPSNNSVSSPETKADTAPGVTDQNKTPSIVEKDTTDSVKLAEDSKTRCSESTTVLNEREATVGDEVCSENVSDNSSEKDGVVSEAVAGVENGSQSHIAGSPRDLESEISDVAVVKEGISTTETTKSKPKAVVRDSIGETDDANSYKSGESSPSIASNTKAVSSSQVQAQASASGDESNGVKDSVEAKTCSIVDLDQISAESKARTEANDETEANIEESMADGGSKSDIVVDSSSNMPLSSSPSRSTQQEAGGNENSSEPEHMDVELATDDKNGDCSLLISGTHTVTDLDMEEEDELIQNDKCTEGTGSNESSTSKAVDDSESFSQESDKETPSPVDPAQETISLLDEACDVLEVNQDTKEDSKTTVTPDLKDSQYTVSTTDIDAIVTPTGDETPMDIDEPEVEKKEISESDVKEEEKSGIESKKERETAVKETGDSKSVVKNISDESHDGTVDVKETDTTESNSQSVVKDRQSDKSESEKANCQVSSESRTLNSQKKASKEAENLKRDNSLIVEERSVSDSEKAETAEEVSSAETNVECKKEESGNSSCKESVLKPSVKHSEENDKEVNLDIENSATIDLIDVDSQETSENSNSSDTKFKGEEKECIKSSASMEEKGKMSPSVQVNGQDSVKSKQQVKSSTDEAMDDEIIFIDDTENSPPTTEKSNKKLSFKEILKSPITHPGLEESTDTTKKNTSASESTKSKENVISVTDNDKPEDSTEEKEGMPVSDKTKKRSLPMDNDSSVAKRSKLDDAMNKLGDHMAHRSSRSQEEEMEDDAVIVEDDNKMQDVPETSSGKTSTSVDGLCVQVTTQALQTFINACVRGYLEKHKNNYLDRLKRQACTIEATGALWKDAAKYLEKSIEELKKQKQSVNRRKQDLSARSKKTPTPSTPVQPQPSASLTLPPSARLNHSQLPQTPQQQIPQSSTAARTTNQFVNSNLGGLRIRGPRAQQATSAPTTPQHLPPNPRLIYNPVPRQPAPPASRQGDSSNRNVISIDLTDDEEPSNNARTGNLQNQRQGQRAGQINNVSKIMNGHIGTFKTVVAPNGYSYLPGVRGSIPSQQIQRSNGPPNALPGSIKYKGANDRAKGIGSTNMYAIVPGGQRPQAVTTAAAATSQQQMLSLGVRSSSTHSLPPSVHIKLHPAPLPTPPVPLNVPAIAKKLPPQPGLKISRVAQGIVLSWNMPPLDGVETILSYQLFAYQETDGVAPSSQLWKKVGDVKALPLPMACTLTQFQEGNKYHFAVRACDQFGRSGPFSDPSTIFLGPK